MGTHQIKPPLDRSKCAFTKAMNVNSEINWLSRKHRLDVIERDDFRLRLASAKLQIEITQKRGFRNRIGAKHGFKFGQRLDQPMSKSAVACADVEYYQII